MTIKEFVSQYNTTHLSESELNDLISHLHNISIDSLTRVRKVDGTTVIETLIKSFVAMCSLCTMPVLLDNMVNGVVYTDYTLNEVYRRNMDPFKCIPPKILDRVDSSRIPKELSNVGYKTCVLRVNALLMTGLNEDLVYEKVADLTTLESLALINIAYENLDKANHYLSTTTNYNDVLLEVIADLHGTEPNLEEEYNHILTTMKEHMLHVHSEDDSMEKLQFATVYLYEIMRLTKDKTLTVERLLNIIPLNVDSQFFKLTGLVALLDIDSLDVYLKLNLGKEPLYVLLVELCEQYNEEILEIIKSKPTLLFNRTCLEPVRYGRFLVKRYEKGESIDKYI